MRIPERLMSGDPQLGTRGVLLYALSVVYLAQYLQGRPETSGLLGGELLGALHFPKGVDLGLSLSAFAAAGALWLGVIWKPVGEWLNRHILKRSRETGRFWADGFSFIEWALLIITWTAAVGPLFEPAYGDPEAMVWVCLIFYGGFVLILLRLGLLAVSVATHARGGH